MRRMVVLTGLILLAVAVSAQAGQIVGQTPPRDSAPRQTGTAVIRGRVLAAGTGLPLRRSLVTIGGVPFPQSRVSYTDAQGRYELKELPAGRYDVSASKPSYVSLTYGQTRGFPRGTPVQLRDGDVLEHVDFNLPRGGIITGRVTDEFGEPVVNATISTLRPQFVAGLRRLAPSGRITQTNDVGEFRLFGLSPGEYFVSASLALPASDDRLKYTPTYYPGTPNAAGAQSIPLTVGQEVSSITIPMILTQTSRVSGVAVDSDRRPMAGGVATAMQWQGAGYGGTATDRAAPDGRFTLPNLAPGEYTVKVSRFSQSGDSEEVAIRAVFVNGDDLAGITVTAQKPSTVRGHIVFEAFAQGPPSSISARELRVEGFRTIPSESVVLGPSRGRIFDDGSFELNAPPGPTILRVASPPTGWQLKAVRLDGRDVTDEGLDLQSAAELTGLELVLTNRSSQVSGTVSDGRHQPVRDYDVVIFGEDSRQWHFQSRFIASSRPDQDGRFTTTGLPPGEYLALALDSIEPGEHTNSAFLERVRPRAIRFSLADGETKTLELVLQPSS